MHDFINRYSIKHVRVSRDYERIDYGYNYNSPALSYRNREETLEMEVPSSGFEELVRVDRKLDDWSREAGEEAYMPRRHPAIAEAYSKYRMLLELDK